MEAPTERPAGTDTIMCDSKELLVGYLYDELDDQERRAFDAHLALCGECREEAAALGATRGLVAMWTPPQPDLALRVVRSEPAPARRDVRSWPAWAMAAAATLVLAASAAIANIEVRYDATGVTVRTGWNRSASVAAVAPAEEAAATGEVDLVALNQRLTAIETALQRRGSGGPAAVEASGPRMSDAELFRRVRELIGDAETRQQRELAVILAQVVKDFDRQRRTDLLAMQQGLGQFQGMTNVEIAQQRDMLNQFIRVAAGREK
jgi:hypothetical protein